MDKRNVDFFLDDKDLDTQEMYFAWFEKIMDGIILLRYKKERKDSTFVSNAQISDMIIRCFSKINRFNKKEQLNTLARKMTVATERYEQKEDYYKVLEKFYDYYRKDPNIPVELTTPFFNEILNKQQDAFCRKEKEKIKNHLTRVLPLTEKKEMQIKRGRKLKKLQEYLKEEKYGKLGLTEEKKIEIIDEVNTWIKKAKYFKKRDLHLSGEILEQLGQLFFTGNLSIDQVNSQIGLQEEDIKQIYNQYCKKMLPFLDHIELDKWEDIRKNIAYDHNHLVIISNEKSENQLSAMSRYEEQNHIDLFNKKENREFIKLLPLCSIIKDFKMEQMKDILTNSNKILQKLTEENPLFDGSMNQILNQFHRVLSLAKIYSHTTPVVVKALGEETVDKILTGDGLDIISRNPKDYVEVYQKMLTRTETKVPKVSGVYNNYTFESGNMSDTMRLLIGTNCLASCLGPEGAGEEMYREALIGENADVILIKDQEESFVARMILYRIGNYIMTSSIIGEQGIQRQFMNKEFLSLIATQLLEKSKQAGDCIEYVFMTKDPSVNLDDDYTLIMKFDLVKGLPHLDWRASSYLIGSTSSSVQIKKEIEGKYYSQTREKIKTKEELNVSDLEKIIALEVLMNGEEEQKNIRTIHLEDYEEIYKGQDFYIGLRQDGSYEKVSLPTNDPRKQQEIKMIENLTKESVDQSLIKIKK